VATLAIGIGANTAIFSAVYAMILRPLPYRDPSALMSVSLRAPGPPEQPELRDAPWSYLKFEAFRASQKAFRR
jgi:putative ABC transport system permease protein